MGKGEKKGHGPKNHGGPEKKEGRENCIALHCKSKEKRFSFCEEHYEQFKFGLIKKDGHPVPDYEKKLEHYKNFKEKQTAHKVA